MFSIQTRYKIHGFGPYLSSLINYMVKERKFEKVSNLLANYWYGSCEKYTISAQ